MDYKILKTFFWILVLISYINAWKWINLYKSTGYQNHASMQTLSESHLFLTGWYSDTMLIGSGQYISRGERDPFIIKVDYNGSLSWFKTMEQVDQPSTISSLSICLDKSENIYFSEVFIDSFKCQNTFITAPDTSQNHLLLAKFDPAGNLLWAKVPEPKSDYYYTHKISSFNGTGLMTTLESSYDVIVNGQSTKSRNIGIEYDLDGNQKQVVSDCYKVLASSKNGIYAYIPDGYNSKSLAVRNQNHELLWKKTNTNCAVISADFDDDGFLYVSAVLSGEATFNGINVNSFDTSYYKKDTTIYIPMPEIGSDVFRRVDTVLIKKSIRQLNCLVVAKLSEDGTMKWMQRIGSNNYINEYGDLLKVMQNGMIFLGGDYTDSISIGSFKIKSTFYIGAFIALLSNDGNVLSAQSLDTIPLTIGHLQRSNSSFHLYNLNTDRKSNVFINGELLISDSLSRNNKRIIFQGCLDAVQHSICEKKQKYCISPILHFRKHGNFIQIKLPYHSADNLYTVSIYNLKGQVLQQKVYKQLSSKDLIIDIPERLPTGNYIMGIKTDKSAYYSTLLKIGQD